MKKVFKASLVAASLALAFGANAASVTSTPLKLSAEGVAAGLEATGVDLSFDISVVNTHPSASEITLTFDETVVLDPASYGCAGTVTNDPALGTGVCGDITFTYGTGSFTFDNVTVDDEAGTISFKVNLGNPLTADSAFRVDLGGAATDITGAANVAYAAETAAGASIETGSGVVATTESQFAFTVEKKFDGIIDRLDRTIFSKNFDVNNVSDESDHNFVNKQADLEAALTNIGLEIEINGSFGGLLTADFTPSAGVGTVSAAPKQLDVVVAGPLGADTDLAIDFSRVTATNIPVSDFTATVVVTSAEGDDITLVSDASIGGWDLDASVVNVPYLPVGYGLTAQVEISNLGDTDAEVMIEAVDQNGDEYGPIAMDFTYGGETFDTARAGTVTRASEADIRKAFNLAADSQKKLSITFVIDADEDDITLVPLYRQNESRINVISDQYKGQ